MLQQSQHLWHQLAMFFRDDLLSSSWRRPLGSSDTINTIDFKQKITTNVDNVIKRINGIAPQYSEKVKPLPIFLIQCIVNSFNILSS